MNKKFTLLFTLILYCAGQLPAQNIYVGHISGSSGDIKVAGSGYLYVSGNASISSAGIYSNGGIVEVKGNISNDYPSMAQDIGTTKLTGAASQAVSGAQPFNVYNVTFNNTSAGSPNIALSSNLNIGNSATFTQGLVGSTGGTVTFLSGTTYSGASDASHIIGPVRKVGNQAFTFPVGDAVMLRNAYIAAPSSSGDIFSAEYVRAQPSSGTLDTGLKHISSVEYWQIDRINGTSNPEVTLSFDDSYSGGISSTSDLRVANLSGTTWKNLGGSASGSSLTALSTPASWGEFTLGSKTPLNPLPIMLLSFSADYSPISKDVILRWVTAMEMNSNYFTIERSTDAENWQAIERQQAAGSSTREISYTAIDHSPLSAIVYYRLKETDIDGTSYSSNIEVVSISSGLAPLSIFPNPIANTATIRYYLDREDISRIEVCNALGQVLIHKEVSSVIGENQIPLDIDQLAPGNYFLKMQSPGFSNIQTEMIIKY